jgi:hypothetical protein
MVDENFKHLLVVSYKTDNVVKRLDLTGMSERQAENVENGLNINLDHSEFYTDGMSYSSVSKKTFLTMMERRDEILNDDRLFYPTAKIEVNAPLALIKLSLVTELHTIESCYGLAHTDIDEIRKNRNND